MIVLGAFPLVFIVTAALTESSLGKPFKKFVGAENFEAVLRDSDVLQSIFRTVSYSFAVTAVSVVLGVLLACAVYEGARKGSVLRTLLLLPLIIPPVIVGTLWKLIYNPSGGLIATVLGYASIPAPQILSDGSLALAAVGVADIWQWTPLVFLLVYASLLGQDSSLNEAARLDGAHGWKLFVHITLPAIGGTIAAAAFIRLVIALKVFDLVFMMTSGGPGQSTTTTSYLIYQAAIKEFDVDRASAITLLLAVVVTVITVPIGLMIARIRRSEGSNA
ncbi:multiple sugar transport system permease protein [Neomicrococcus aestuarii]|uniref:Multiple sugar transport system permease protein n=1 Tax=Neomicrococcus aestuarii TaxID=556325 RepID=A0A7W8TVG6_9MICC|nr:sugar ABC transporter permease [Neomicrococcus aestuarii]MBB5513662.1 multiple sugar transport system permease protein [Neomicrococcus aestuarii]